MLSYSAKDRCSKSEGSDRIWMVTPRRQMKMNKDTGTLTKMKRTEKWAPPVQLSKRSKQTRMLMDRGYQMNKASIHIQLRVRKLKRESQEDKDLININELGVILHKIICKKIKMTVYNKPLGNWIHSCTHQ